MDCFCFGVEFPLTVAPQPPSIGVHDRSTPSSIMILNAFLEKFFTFSLVIALQFIISSNSDIKLVKALPPFLIPFLSRKDCSSDSARFSSTIFLEVSSMSLPVIGALKSSPCLACSSS